MMTALRVLLLAACTACLARANAPHVRPTRPSTHARHPPAPQPADVADFHKYYTRPVEDYMWGAPLPDDASIPRSGLGAFMILWTHDGPEQRARLKRCLQALDVFFNDKHGYPVVVMHNDVDAAAQAVVRSWTRSSVEFVAGATHDPAYAALFDQTGFKVHADYTNLRGYLEMIRHTYRWPLHRALFGYRYVFKLDSDAYFVEPIPFDVFAMMRDQDVKAAYVADVVDSPEVCQHLYETVQDVLRYNRIEPAQDIYRQPTYWTWYGFAIVFDTAFVRSPAFLNTVWHFDNVHGAFRYRWGDPQLYLLTSMFLTAQQTKQLALPMIHQHRCVHTAMNASCGAQDVPGWSEGVRTAPSSPPAADDHWSWLPGYGWSRELWPVDPTTQPPYRLQQRSVLQPGT